jgi:hypothetical protein
MLDEHEAGRTREGTARVVEGGRGDAQLLVAKLVGGGRVAMVFELGRAKGDETGVGALGHR